MFKPECSKIVIAAQAIRTQLGSLLCSPRHHTHSSFNAGYRLIPLNESYRGISSRSVDDVIVCSSTVNIKKQQPTKLLSIRSIVLHKCFLYYFAPGSGAKYCDQCVCTVCLSVCVSVRLSARISQQPHAKTSRNFLYTLPVASVTPFSDT